jgi:hypothetical protein
MHKTIAATFGRTAAVLAAINAFGVGIAVPSAAIAQDQIRYVLYDGAGFNVIRMYLENCQECSSLDKREENFSLGQAKNVKWNVTGKATAFNSLRIRYKYDGGYGIETPGICPSAAISLDQDAKQITKVTLPDGTDIVRSKLDDKVDQIVRLDFKVVGTTTSKKCTYTGFKVYKR